MLRVLLVVVALVGVIGVERAVVSEFSEPGNSAEADVQRAEHSAGCQRRARPVRVRLSRRRWPHIVAHLVAVRGRYPRVWHIDRAGASENRAESLRGWPTRPGFDRDEVPAAVAREGGRGASVAYVRSGENRSAGASMGGQLRKWCDGQSFRLIVGR